jgi:two-component system, NarL family, invasion response regulator UvrY
VEAATADDALALLKEADWKLVILDLAMPGEHGLSFLRKVKATAPGTPALVVSMYPADQFARRAADAGAAGYINKTCDVHEVVRAARILLSGRALPRPDDTPPAPEHPHDCLSDREYQVLRLIAMGRTVSDIAERLSLSVKTVSTYRSRILEKMNMRNNAELMRYAIEKALHDPPA